MLRIKIKQNILKRTPPLEDAINDAIQDTFNDNTSSSADYRPLACITPFKVPESLIITAINILFEEINQWKGVKVSMMSRPPSNWEQYHKPANNWWNRHKAQLLGDHLIHPLLTRNVKEYVDGIVKYNTQQKRRTLINDLLFFKVLTNMTSSKVTFDKTRAQPLIPDQAYKTSKLLKNMFIDLSNKYCIKWDIDSHRYSRFSVQKWIRCIQLQLEVILTHSEKTLSPNIEPQLDASGRIITYYDIYHPPLFCVFGTVCNGSVNGSDSYNKTPILSPQRSHNHIDNIVHRYHPYSVGNRKRFVHHDTNNYGYGPMHSSSYFYDNYNEEMNIESLLARKRVRF